MYSERIAMFDLIEKYFALLTVLEHDDEAFQEAYDALSDIMMFKNMMNVKPEVFGFNGHYYAMLIENGPGYVPQRNY